MNPKNPQYNLFDRKNNKTYTDQQWKQLCRDIFKLLSPDALISMYSTHQVFG